MNRQASIFPPRRGGAHLAVDLSMDRCDADRHVSECQVRFDEASTAFERNPTAGSYEAMAMARTRLGRARHDVERPDYHRPEVFGFIRRQHQPMVPARPALPAAPIRVPRSRAAAHRPRARTAARAGPPPSDDSDGEPEPPLAAAVERQTP